MSTSKKRQEMRQARQRLRANLITEEDRKKYPNATKAYITFGGDWDKRKADENNHRPSKRVLRSIRSGNYRGAAKALRGRKSLA